MGELAIREDVAVSGHESLAELAAIANREDELALTALASALAHAIEAGRALNRAKEIVGWGNWVEWQERNFDGSSRRADTYRRLARHSDLIIAQNFKTVSAAEFHLRELTRGDREQEVEFRAERAQQMQRLRRIGMSLSQIAEIFGVNESTVSTYTSPKARAAKRRRKRLDEAARKVARQRAREGMARAAGGLVAKAYSQTRLLAETLERAAESEDNLEARGALRSALSRLYSVEDAVVSASRKKT